MNRYSQITTSEFNPLSFQEIMAAPLAMRQKHDASIAQAEALRIKANPLDKHLNRALEIKNQMDAEIAKNVDTLNKEGYNPTTFQNIQRLNRQYQDMISPTGEIGKINAAKQVYVKNFNDDLEWHHVKNSSSDKKNHFRLIPLCGHLHHRNGDLSPHGNAKRWRETFSLEVQLSYAAEIHLEYINSKG